MYMAELAPPSIRGNLINFYQSWLFLGAMAASGTVDGSSKHLHGQRAYKTGESYCNRKCLTVLNRD